MYVIGGGGKIGINVTAVFGLVIIRTFIVLVHVDLYAVLPVLRMKVCSLSD